MGINLPLLSSTILFEQSNTIVLFPVLSAIIFVVSIVTDFLSVIFSITIFCDCVVMVIVG